MDEGFVIFSEASVFDAAHEAEMAAQNYPIISRSLKGEERPNAQKAIAITNRVDHPNKLDNRVIAFIPKKWSAEAKANYTFLTKEQAKLEGFFPNEL